MLWRVLSGGGTSINPYLIQSRLDFDEFANPANSATYWASGRYTKLMCDVNLSDTTYTQAVIAPDTSTSPDFQGAQFTGVFNGNGHVIGYLTITAPTKDYIGLFGAVNGGQISNLGVVNTNIQGHDYVGGLVGSNNSGTLTSCYATGSVSGNWYVGGLVGEYFGLSALTDCYATGLVDGIIEVGGLVGVSTGVLTKCYATGPVTGTNHVGGLVGYNYSGSITACFWDVNTSGQLASAGGTGKTTAQMKTLSIFTSAGWDFASVWAMPLGQYPILFLRQTGDLNSDTSVDVLDFALFAGHWLDSR